MLRYLHFELSDGSDGVVTLDALASTRPEQHEAVLAEVARVLAWAEASFPDQHGPLEEGMSWLHELQLRDEPGGWRSVALTFSATPEFADAFLAAWSVSDD